LIDDRGDRKAFVQYLFAATFLFGWSCAIAAILLFVFSSLI